MLQEEALNLLKMGKNIFLTGAAGAGKTYVLNQYIKYLKDNNVGVAVTASTGIAATHLKGTTIHAWSGIGVRSSLTPGDLDKLFTNSRIKRNYKKAKVLIIDEISMLHGYQLDMVDSVASFILGNQTCFGGIQVVLCGDFFQLPPVASNNMSGSKNFAFESLAWQRGNFYVCYLHEQHRQKNDPLLTILNDIRSGTAGEHTKVPLRTRYKKDPMGECKPTKLYSRNINVDAINEQELANLTSTERTFIMSTDGFSMIVDGLKKSCLAVEKLRLKIGAEVMFIKNDTAGRYVNGTRGVVIDFNKGEEGGTLWPVVRTYDNYHVIACAEEWKYEDNGIVRATITQVPLRLAWAVTIHKSQGMTLDAAEMDLGDVFEPGMGYVALSRVRNLSGLKLLNLNDMALKVHPQILMQDKLFQADSISSVSYLQGLKETEKTTYQRDTLIKRFEAYTESSTSPHSKKKKQPTKEKSAPTHLITLNMLKEKMSVEEIARERNLSPATIVNHLEKLKGLKEIDVSDMMHLKNMLPKEDFGSILSVLQKSADGRLKPIFDKFNGKYAYHDIQLVRLFVV